MKTERICFYSYIRLIFRLFYSSYKKKQECRYLE